MKLKWQMMNSKQKYALFSAGSLLFIFMILAAFTYIHPLAVQWDKAVAYTRASLHKYVPMTGEDVQNIRQMMTADPSTSRTIMWESVIPEEEALIEYRQVGQPQDAIETAKAKRKTFTDDGVSRYEYEVTLTGLSKNTEYQYRIGAGDKRSQWMPFKTAGIGDFTAIIFPDSQSANYKGWAELVKTAWAQNPQAAFFANMGDLVDNGEMASQWNAWFSATEDMNKVIPFAGVMGNHETYTLDWKVRPPKAYLNLFSFPSNGYKQYQNQFYSFDYNGVHFVALDTQAEEETNEPQLLTDEVAWLKKDLASTKMKWKVVLMHKDVFQYAFANQPGRDNSFSPIGKLFMPIFDEYKVDLVLSAHLHTYRRRGHVKNFKRDASGPSYILTGVAGDVRYVGLWADHPLDIKKSPYYNEANYLVLKKANDALIISAYRPDGMLFDSETITQGL